MNINEDAYRILIYGDSLTYGRATGERRRLRTDERFTGILQKNLGTEFEVIEEGLRARTLSGENSFYPERNGLEQFGPIMGSHLFFDLLIILLGTNDCNNDSNKSHEEIINALREYKQKLKDWCKLLEFGVPKILIVSPPKIEPKFYDEGTKKTFGAYAPVKQQKLVESLEAGAKLIGANFLKSENYCQPAKGDGIHLDAKGNRNLAKALQARIEETI